MMKIHEGNSKINGSTLVYFFKLFCVLFGIWILLSGKFETKFLLAGFLSSLICAAIFMPLFTVQSQKTGEPLNLFEVNPFKLLVYLIWLIVEIIKTSTDATILVLRGMKAVSPQIVYFRMDFDNPIATALLANSITLTPGTITLSVDEEGVFEVHALTQAAADGLLSGIMQKKVADLYRESCLFKPLPERTLYTEKGAAAHG